MGCCASQVPDDDSNAKSRDAAITKNLQKANRTESRIIKLLLLGTGESGKSTFFKQMQIIHADGFSEYERTTYRHVVRRNVVESMQVLLNGASIFGFKIDPASVKAAEFMIEMDTLRPEFWQPEAAQHISTLWKNEPAVALAYKNKSKLQIPDSAEYLFDRVDVIGLPDYVPTPEDILRARLRTSGIVKRDFLIHDVVFQFIDVGGQRNERRKWIHCFDDVTAILFVAAVSEYDQVLYEDEKVNRLKEAIMVFSEICNNRHFVNTAMILFLNKSDLFKKKIGDGVPITVCFPNYEGSGEWQDALEYIKWKFIEENQTGSDIFAHTTCATDTENVDKVFEAVRKVVLKKNLERLGLT